tara:strand:+ start:3005 stop:3499 length:495 start_codon:yes stop_codon:yes gene_type:complete
MLFKKKYSKNLGRHNCFTSIEDLPIKIWFEIHKTGDYTTLMKVLIPLSEKVALQLATIWNKIYDEYITSYGLTDEFLAELRTEIKLANLQAEYVITGKRYYKTLIKIEQEKKRLLGEDLKQPIEIESILAKMSKYYGFKLSSKELTVAEYYSYINNVIEDGKKN